MSIRRFDEDPSAPKRALQIWLILLARAELRRTITYGDVARILGYDGAGVLAHILGHIMYHCQRNKLPPLTVLVVNQKTGLPGDGLVAEDIHAQREAVFGYDWYAIEPPLPEELVDSLNWGREHAG
ncbi:MAG: hypothetical protein HYV07_07620 [Deltaproteobacteria bacterium]|nr:hypothetical protein [Deltaproteobacteria bacterium]